jgi:hypothetical protein
MAQPSSFPFQDLPPEDTETMSFDPDSRPVGWTEADEQQSIDDAHEGLLALDAERGDWVRPDWWTAEDHERWQLQCDAMEDLGF